MRNAELDDAQPGIKIAGRNINSLRYVDAAAAAKSLQLCPTLCHPIDGSDSVPPHRWQPTRIPCPWDSPGKNTGVGCCFLLQCMKVKSESEVAQFLEWGAIAFSRCVDDTTLMAESEEELKNLLIKVKEESDKAGLKLSIQKAKIMASGPIISWQIGGETMETVTDVISLGSKITMDGDCRHEIKRWLAPWKKSYDKPR